MGGRFRGVPAGITAGFEPAVLLPVRRARNRELAGNYILDESLPRVGESLFGCLVVVAVEVSP